MGRICRWTLIAVALLGLAAGGGHAVTADWQADHFVVYGGEPLKRPEGRLTAEWASTMLDRLDTGLAHQREGELAWIADRYQQAGLEAPKLDPVVPRAEGGTGYGVFFFPFTGSNSRDALAHNTGGYEAFPWQFDGCEPITSGWISFNTDRPPTGDAFFDTMAHELFHAVQAAYPLRRDCLLATWIDEGTANAVGHYMFKQKLGRDAGVISGQRSAQGLRPYHVPLHYEEALDGTLPRVVTGDVSIEREHIGYATGSFWLFLVEATGGLEYLDTLMSRRVAGDSPESRLRWLHGGLEAESRFRGDDLYALYPEFVTEFASWGGARYPVVAEKNFGGDEEAARERWLQLAFDGCAEIEVGPGDSDTVSWLDFNNGGLEPLAARCVRVTYGEPLVETTPVVEAVHASSEGLDGVHLGVAWESGPQGERNCWQEDKPYRPGTPKCVVKVQHDNSSPDRWVRSWNEAPISPGGVAQAFGSGATEKIYILSNVRPDAPWDTEEINVTFRVGLPATELGSGAPADPPEDSTIRKSESTEELAERAEAGDVSVEEAFEIVSGMMDGIMSGPTPEQAYGAEGSIGLPVAPTELGSFSFVRADGSRVSLQPMPGEDGGELSFGETGPLTGTVMLEGDDDSMALAMSTLCADNEGRAGRVVESTEDRLVIRIATDICGFDPANPTGCENGCPQVDRVDATLKLPGGWRYYASTAPESVVTPGIEDYIRRFVDMDAPGFVARPEDETDSPRPTPTDDAGGGGTGVAPVVPGERPRPADDSDESEEAPDEVDCECTCEEFERLTEAVEQTSTPGAIDFEAINRLQVCTGRCMEDYIDCRRR